MLLVFTNLCTLSPLGAPPCPRRGEAAPSPGDWPEAELWLFPQGESVKYFLDNLDRIGQLVSTAARPRRGEGGRGQSGWGLGALLASGAPETDGVLLPLGQGRGTCVLGRGRRPGGGDSRLVRRPSLTAG